MLTPHRRTGPTVAVVALSPDYPLLRGKLHLVVALLVPFGAIVLLRAAASGRALVGAAIFALSLMLMYGISATYHVAARRGRLRRIIKRLDHAMIFVLIAGTYTPFCLLVLGSAWGIIMLCVVWGVAAGGVLMKLLWPDAPRGLAVSTYLAEGWLALVASSQLITAVPATPLLLLLAGGVLYSAGALVYWFRRPDPFPRVFGYHEVFHTLVVAATGAHFAVIAAYVLPS